MAFSTSPSSSLGDDVWATIKKYVVPASSAVVGIVPSFRGLLEKSNLQLGVVPYKVPFMTGLKEGLKASPLIGATIGVQVFLEEQVRAKGIKDDSLTSRAISAAVVGVISAPALAKLNARSMLKSGKVPLPFTPTLALPIAVQEAAFIYGLGTGKLLATKVSEYFSIEENKVVTYASVFFAGGVGSFVGHPASTALTLWQSGQPLKGFEQSMLGSMRKARAVGLFSVIYTGSKDLLNSL